MKRAREAGGIMHRHFFLRRAVVLGAVATVSLLVIGPAAKRRDGIALDRSAACAVATDQVRFDFPLPRTARLLVSGLPIKVVALGSSSTRGAGASTPAACYPSRL